MTLHTQVGDVSPLVGLLLVLVTLFTSEQSRALDAEKHRTGNPRASALRRVLALSAALALVTAVSWLSLLPLAVHTLANCCRSPFDPILPLFDLIWILLVPLAGWQVVLARHALALKASLSP